MNQRNYTTEDYQSIFSDKERDSLADLDREPELTNFHSARTLSHFEIVKAYDSEGGWTSLWKVRDRGGNPLPKELQGSFTDVNGAIKSIQNYLSKTRDAAND